MKKYFLSMLIALTVIFGFTSSGFAINEYEEEDEFYYNNIYVGYGFLSVPSISAALLEAIAFTFSAPFTDDERTIKDKGSFGPLFIGADYFLTDNFSLGGIFSYEDVKRRWVYSDGVSTTGYCDWNWSFISIMGRLNIQYGWDNFKFYHSLMIGGSRVGIGLDPSEGANQSSSEYTWAAHVALLGIKIGKEFSVFADVGVGYLGIINFGASLSF